LFTFEREDLMLQTAHIADRMTARGAAAARLALVRLYSISGSLRLA
jgi:hypothetical protein